MSFGQGLSGLSAASKDLDVIGNNVANSSTVGFKQSQAQFSDVFANTMSTSGGNQIGIGVRVATVAQQFTQGNITVTNNPLDVAVNGAGFFRMSNNGSISYTRNGQFQLDKAGYVVNSSGLHLTGYAVNSNGLLLSGGAPSDLQITTTDISPTATPDVAAKLNLDSRSFGKTPLTAAAFNPTDPTTYHNSTSITTYDSQGNPHTFSTFYVSTAANTWAVFGTLDGSRLNGTNPVGTLTFKSDGSIDTTATTLPFTVTAALTNGATTPLTFPLDFTGTTQFGSNFSVNALNQTGNTSGHLTGFSVGADGTVLGRYSNGMSKTLGQVVLASFANPQGLLEQGNNQFAETPTSGAPLVSAPGSGTLGVLQSSAVEDSNVDLTAELVKMITAQRAYQANAQTIKTQDAVLQTLVNLR